MIRPDGEPWTLETFTAEVETTGVWSIVDFSRIEQSLRMDGEYYQPLYLHYANITLSGETLETNTAITHPIEIKRVYEKSGVQILLAQNIRYNRLDFSTVVYMPLSVVNQISRNKLSVDDVVMTRSGANFGDAAVYKGVPSEIYACADCLIIRPRDIPGGYLSTYLNTKIGRALLTRGAYGMAQPHIAPNYLYTMRLPQFGDDFEQEIDKDSDDTMNVWIELLEGCGVDLESVWFGESCEERERIYEFRHKLPQKINEFLRQHNQQKLSTDIAVPAEHFYKMYDFYKEKANEAGITYVNFGHVGEQHLHFNFLPRTDKEYVLGKRTIDEFVRFGVKLGGTVSAEHGIGKIKKDYLKIMYGKRHIEEMVRLKAYFDPNFILGRDNIFDKNIFGKL